jgi:hypothetical protein
VTCLESVAYTILAGNLEEKSLVRGLGSKWEGTKGVLNTVEGCELHSIYLTQSMDHWNSFVNTDFILWFPNGGDILGSAEE